MNDATSYRHAAFRIALRQDITAAFTNQRPMQLPLHIWQSSDAMTDADDAVWSRPVDRILLSSRTISASQWMITLPQPPQACIQGRAI